MCKLIVTESAGRASGLKRVVYKRDDGVIISGIAIYSYRGGPIGEWMIGDIPLRDIPGKIISEEYIPTLSA